MQNGAWTHGDSFALLTLNCSRNVNGLHSLSFLAFFGYNKSKQDETFICTDFASDDLTSTPCVRVDKNVGSSVPNCIFLVSYVEERPWWPIQNTKPQQRKKKKAKG